MPAGLINGRWPVAARPDRHLVRQAEAKMLDASARMAQIVMPSHLLTSIAIWLVFGQAAPRGYLPALNVAMGLLVGATMAAIWLHRHLLRRPALSERTARRQTRIGFAVVRSLSFATGLVWATVPAILFPATGDGYDKLLATSITVGLIAYTYVCGPIRHASTLFIVPLAVGCLQALRFVPYPFNLCLFGLLVLYGISVAIFADRLCVVAYEHEFGKAQVQAQNETIGLLLKDFQAEASDWLWETDDSGRITLAPGRMTGLLAERAAEPGGMTLTALLSQATTEPARVTAIIDAMAHHRPFQDVAIPLHAPGGGIRWWRLSGRPAGNPGGHFIGYRGVGSDITRARLNEERIGYLASHDTLTSLPNRASFMDAMEAACRDCVSRPIALLYVDLDGFKAVNDCHGHTLGDRLLQAVAGRLQAIGDAATAFRLGGDEFAIVLAAASRARGNALAARVTSLLARPYCIDGLSLEIGASIGVAFAPDDATDPASLLHRADLALYEAKATGNSLWKCFDPTLEARVQRRRLLDMSMRAALGADLFELHYQPIYDIPTGKLTGAEALLRWNLPGEGWIAPAEIIPIAEATGFIREIGAWALRRACRDMRPWPELSVAVNISSIHFLTASFCNEVQTVLRETGFDPRHLEIEVTESMLLDSGPHVTQTLRRLREMGVRIVLDDFGTGYSSLSYLRQFTFDKLKIDRSFVAGIDSQPGTQAIIGAIHSMAGALDLSITVEGVETLEQMQALRSLSNGSMQGYYLGRPRPVAEFAALATRPRESLAGDRQA